MCIDANSHLFSNATNVFPYFLNLPECCRKCLLQGTPIFEFEYSILNSHPLHKREGLGSIPEGAMWGWCKQKAQHPEDPKK